MFNFFFPSLIINLMFRLFVVTILVFASFLGVIQSLSIQTLSHCGDPGVRVPSADPLWVCNSQNGTWDYPGNLTLSASDVLIMDATLHVHGAVTQPGWTCIPYINNRPQDECSNFDQDAVRLKVGVFNEGLSIQYLGGLIVDGQLDGMYRLDVDSDKRIQVNPKVQSFLPSVILHSYDGVVMFGNPLENPVVFARVTDAFEATRLSCERGINIHAVASYDPVGDNQHLYKLWFAYYPDDTQSCYKKQIKMYDDYVNQVVNNPTTTTGSDSAANQVTSGGILLNFSLCSIVLSVIMTSF